MINNYPSVETSVNKEIESEYRTFYLVPVGKCESHSEHMNNTEKPHF